MADDVNLYDSLLVEVNNKTIITEVYCSNQMELPSELVIPFTARSINTGHQFT